ncbi:hypothetical protein HG537_0C00520 [Torulaspora globosa]|uniref:Required for respiratory growth protein 9, mitochondrial n=1 Tax=Torulaspora globosa TaxID=48254 RepID=A0A7H9HSP6_9SACH|nr:hypothetical protein HG537_0C00520 [Torulaspora sp. CBS 2947]
MKFPVVFVRWFHHRRSLEAAGAKSAKGVLKLVKEASGQNESETKELPSWKKQVLALKRKFKGERWNPAKKLSRTEMDGMRLLRAQFPQLSASELAERYKVSPEVVRRILKSKWRPTEEEMVRVHERWKKRGERIQELYQTSPELRQGRIEPRKRISIASGRRSSDLVVRSTTNFAKQQKPALNSEKNSGAKKSKLFLLQRSVRND